LAAHPAAEAIWVNFLLSVKSFLSPF